jgi:hypothetical protein
MVDFQDGLPPEELAASIPNRVNKIIQPLLVYRDETTYIEFVEKADPSQRIFSHIPENKHALKEFIS